MIARIDYVLIQLGKYEFLGQLTLTYMTSLKLENFGFHIT